MRKQLHGEDLTMVFQWIVAILVTPFMLLPLFPRQNVSFTTRLLIVVGAYVIWGVLTVIFLAVRPRSRRGAAMVVNVIACTDIILVTACMIAWPRFMPDLFLVFPLLVIAVATRFDYRVTAFVTLALSALYGVTIISRFGSAPARTVVWDTLIRIGFLALVALSTAYLSKRERRQRSAARVLSGVAAAIGSTLHLDELMQTVVDGISMASGLDRCTSFLTGKDGRWAVPQSTTEKDPGVRDEILRMKIDLKRDNGASRALATGEPVIITDIDTSPLVDKKWVKQFGLGALLVLPIILRDRAMGVVVVERRDRKRFFLDREVNTCVTVLAQAAAGLENVMRYEEEQRKRSQSDVLYRTSRELGSTLELDQVLENACNLAMRSTDSSGCSAFTADEGNGLLVPRVSTGSGRARRVEFPLGSGISVEEVEDMYAVSERPPALLLRCPGENAAIPPFLREEGVVLLAPFYAHGRMTGALCVSGEASKEFSETQVTQFAAIAGETALAVENATLHERIKSDAAQLASMVQMANAVGSTTDLSTIMGLALDTVRHMFNCTAGLIYRVDENEGTLRYIDSFGYPEEALQRLTSMPYPSVEDCWTVSEGRLIGIDDLSKRELSCHTLEKIGTGSSICVGMKVEERTLGVLHIRSDKPGAFREEDQQLALAISDQVALALQRALLFEEINRLAITDPLTGVFNVRRLEWVLQDELNRSRRYDRPVSFLMVDEDNLKAYNDTLGHQKGDVVLSQVASIIDSNTRDVDKVFRYGGDEFCVVLPETDSRDAFVVADKIRKVVSEFHFPDQERIPGGTITISLGVSSLSGEAGEVSDLVNKADVALYTAKQKGRNSVSAAE